LEKLLLDSFIGQKMKKGNILKKPTKLGKELLQVLNEYLKNCPIDTSDCTTSDLATMMNRSQRSIAGIVTQLQHINLAYVKRTSVHGEKITFVYLTNQGRDYIAGVV
tara:strand:- start:1008 stop:1328 length:321 start_codon:yes stop_codon:yes gene_type:complete